MASATRFLALAAGHALVSATKSRYAATRSFRVERDALRQVSRCAGAPPSTSLNTSKPATFAVPPLAGMKQERMRMVVDLPAPLGPRKPDDLTGRRRWNDNVADRGDGGT